MTRGSESEQQPGLACVYVRQSTLQQVRTNQESRRRQEALVDRARDLGWPPERIEVIDDDQGTSGEAPVDQRPGYLRLIRQILDGQVGIVLAVEVSRLAREDIAWVQMIQFCHFNRTLLADEEHVYDPTDSHSLMVLGVLGTIASFELKLIRDRMIAGSRRKAARGELFVACPPGYIVENDQMSLTPDQRLQRTVAVVLRQFEQQAGVSALCRWCCDNGIQLPVCRDRVGRRIDWCEPTTRILLRLLRNPVYAGAYVHGRTRTETSLDSNGRKVTRKVAVPMEQWTVIRDHHTAYISWEQFQINYRRIQESNSMRTVPAGRPAQRGQALLAGMLRCRQCGYGLNVRYSGKTTARYLCRQGGRQRNGHTSGCMSVPATPLDRLVEQLVLEVVRPAGVQAALDAAEELGRERAEQRRILADRVQQGRYEADRAARQYNQADPENRLVCAELERRWNRALEALQDGEERLSAFDRQRPLTPEPADVQTLMELGKDLGRVWNDPDTSPDLRKQVVRLLIDSIVVARPETDRLQASVHWVGGCQTEHVLDLKARPDGSPAPNLPDCIDRLRLILDDEASARALNRAAIRMPRGDTWNAARVARFRSRHKIPAFSAEEKKRRGLLTQEEAAAALGVSPMTVHRLLVDSILPGTQPAAGLPWTIEAAALGLPAVRYAVQGGRSQSMTTPGSRPDQLSLW